MTFDARFGAVLDAEYATLYQDVSGRVAADYLRLRERLASEMGRNLDWLVSSAASRDNFLSPLFHYCVVMKVVDEWHQAYGSLPDIIVDSLVLKKTLQKLVKRLGSTSNISVQSELNESGEGGFRSRLFALRTALFVILRWASIKWLLKVSVKTEESRAGPIRLIDTFVVSPDPEEDRYYSGLVTRLCAYEKAETYWVPSFHNLSIRQINTFVSASARSSRRFLFKERWLSFSEVLWACFHSLRVKELRFREILWCEVNINELWIAEIKSTRQLFGAVEGLLNYRFFERLNQSGIIVSHAIDWFENQAVDAGWNLGMHQFFPDAETIGYQGFFSSNQGATPVSYEYRLGTIPRRLCVMGKGLLEERSKWCPEIDLAVAPAFRFSWLWEPRQTAGEDLGAERGVGKVLLIVMPADKWTAFRLWELSNTLTRLNLEWNIWVKLHPALPISEFQVAQTLAEHIKFVNGTLRDLFLERPVVLCGGLTTAGLEALASGLPAVFFHPPGHRSEAPVPEFLIDPSLFICESAEAVLSSLKNIEILLTEDPHQFVRTGEKIRSELFSPVTESGLGTLGF